MKIECTVEELKQLLKKEQTESKSERSVDEKNGSLIFKAKTNRRKRYSFDVKFHYIVRHI